jgi:hypothetical protein
MQGEEIHLPSSPKSRLDLFKRLHLLVLEQHVLYDHTRKTNNK